MCDVIARGAVVAGEDATNQRLAVRLQCDRVEIRVRAGDARAGVERRVERAVRLQACDVCVCHAVDLREEAADDRLAVGLERQADYTGEACTGHARVVGAAERAVCFVAAQSAARCTVELRELPADQHFAVRLLRHGEHGVVRARAGIEGCVERAGRACDGGFPALCLGEHGVAREADPVQGMAPVVAELQLYVERGSDRGFDPDLGCAPLSCVGVWGVGERRRLRAGGPGVAEPVWPCRVVVTAADERGGAIGEGCAPQAPVTGAAVTLLLVVLSVM